jgi:hypothetical protein
MFVEQTHWPIHGQSMLFGLQCGLQPQQEAVDRIVLIPTQESFVLLTASVCHFFSNGTKDFVFIPMYF